MASVVETLMARAAARPEALAYLDAERAIGYRELLRRTGLAAAWLWQQGVRPDDVVALSLEAPARAARAGLYLFYGAAYLGAAVLPLYPGLSLKERGEYRRRYGASW